MDDLVGGFNGWRDDMENGGVRVGVNETKVVIGGEWQRVMQRAVGWPCGVCGRGVQKNSNSLW